MKYALLPLPYSFDALEPYIDARTMEIHYTKHHQKYVDELNAAIEKHPDYFNMDPAKLLKNLDKIPKDIRESVQNNGGGHVNHTFFWQLMKKNGGGEPKGTVADAIKNKFGSFKAFQELFNTAAKKRFGSGWAWLSIDRSGELQISSTANQDNPILFGWEPVLGLDVWEHAYYLKYQNKKPDYIDAWWQVINWDFVEEAYRALVNK